MVDVFQLGFGGLLVVVGLGLVVRVWRFYGQYQTVQTADDDLAAPLKPDEVTTVHGAVHVAEPTSVPDTPIELADVGDPIGLLAWRIREKKSRRSGSGSGSRTTWKTTDGGLAVGDIAVEDEDGMVSIDSPSVDSLVADGRFSTADPFEAGSLHLGDPVQDVPLGEGGPLSDMPITISVGTMTNQADRFQATIVSDGDPLLVHGKLEVRNGEFVMREDDDTSLLVASGTISQAADRLRTKMIKNGAIAAAIVVIGIAIGIAAVA